MNLTIQDLLLIIGAKEAELVTLRNHIQAMEAQIKTLSEKVEAQGNDISDSAQPKGLRKVQKASESAS